MEQQTSLPASGSRANKGTIVSLAGMGINLLLAVAKIVVGAISGLLSVMADGFNNLSDCGSGVISFASFRIAEKPADKEHPFGHHRVEYVASMLIAFMILLLGVELLRESVSRIVAGESAESGFAAYLVMGISLLVKGGMFFGYRIAAKKLDSDPLRAAAVDSACDCLSTGAVLVGLIIRNLSGFPADGWAGLLVTLFIAWEGIGILRDASSKLVGQAADPELVLKLRTLICSQEGVLGVHDIQVFNYGYGATFATVHVELPASLSSSHSHAKMDFVERLVWEKMNVHLTAHCDPVDLDDTEAQDLHMRVKDALLEKYPEWDVHDFRLVRGVKRTLVFEVGVPFSYQAKNYEVEQQVRETVQSLGDFDLSVTVERE